MTWRAICSRLGAVFLAFRRTSSSRPLMMTQLNPPLPLETPKGKAWAVALIDYGPQWELQWVTFVRDTGECWTFRNSQIRQGDNYTFALPNPTPIEETPVEAAPMDPMKRCRCREGAIEATPNERPVERSSASPR